MRLFTALLLTFVSAVISCTAPINKASFDKAAEELNIREATFRYQFSNNHSGLKQSASHYYLAIRIGNTDSDPDDTFMARFVGNIPSVRKVSECKTSLSKGVIDRRTGKRGLIFNTEEITWVSDSEVKVSGGYLEASLSSSSNTYHLKKVDGKWKVTRDDLDRIS
jgi:hypothetical protein